MGKENLVWQNGKVEYGDRCRIINQKGLVIWFTGFSGSGKSTISIELEKILIQLGKLVCRLDGDNIRYGLCSDLGFSEKDRTENIRRIAEVSKLFKDAGIITLVSLITPLESMRKLAKDIVGDNFFTEVYVKASIEACIERDPKGMYRKAIAGEIKNFTGITALYENPKNPDIIIDTESLNVDESIAVLLNYVKSMLNNFSSDIINV